jgi:hypothetical protein
MRTSCIGEVYEYWLALPRFEMAEGGDALEQGLKEYNAWVNQHVSRDAQIRMLARIAVEEIENAAPVAIIQIGWMSHWLQLAARDKGLSVEAFVRSKLRYFANAEREAAIKAFTRQSSDALAQGVAEIRGLMAERGISVEDLTGTPAKTGKNLRSEAIVYAGCENSSSSEWKHPTLGRVFRKPNGEWYGAPRNGSKSQRKGPFRTAGEAVVAILLKQS